VSDPFTTALADSPADRYRNRGCAVGRALRSLPPELAERVRSAMADGGVNHASIARGLRAVGADPQPRQNTIGRHRRGECSCG
jgi:hypothetical protein